MWCHLCQCSKYVSSLIICNVFSGFGCSPEIPLSCFCSYSAALDLQYNTCMHFECCNHSREQWWNQYKYYPKFTGDWLIFTNSSIDAGSMNIGIELRTLKTQTLNTMSYLIALSSIIFLVKKCKWLEQARIVNKKWAPLEIHDMDTMMHGNVKM